MSTRSCTIVVTVSTVLMCTKQTDASLMLLTFDANEHELVERQRTVVGHDLSGLHAAQADLAEVLFAGETRQGYVGQV